MPRYINPYQNINSDKKPADTSGRSSNNYARKAGKVYDSLAEISGEKVIKYSTIPDPDYQKKKDAKLISWLEKHDARGSKADPISAVPYGIHEINQKPLEGFEKVKDVKDEQSKKFFGLDVENLFND